MTNGMVPKLFFGYGQVPTSYLLFSNLLLITNILLIELTLPLSLLLLLFYCSGAFTYLFLCLFLTLAHGQNNWCTCTRVWRQCLLLWQDQSVGKVMKHMMNLNN